MALAQIVLLNWHNKVAPFNRWRESTKIVQLHVISAMPHQKDRARPMNGTIGILNRQWSHDRLAGLLVDFARTPLDWTIIIRCHYVPSDPTDQVGTVAVSSLGMQMSLTS